MADLRIPLRRHLKDPDDERLERIRRKIAVARRAQAPARGRMLAVAAAVLLVAAGTIFVAVVVLPGEGREDVERPQDWLPLTLRSGEPLDLFVVVEDEEGPREFDLSDGSRIEIHPDTEVRTLDNTRGAVRMRLERGRATFDVRPGGPRRWSIEAGAATVEVLGTSFTVERALDQVSVSVERGLVEVRSEQLSEGMRQLSAGQTLVLQLSEDGEARHASPSIPSDMPVEEPETEPDGGTKTSRRADMLWQELARQGNHREAYDLLGAGGVSREMNRAESLDRLLALADVARLSGHPSEAVAPLERALAAYPGDRRASLAAFTLGRVYFDQLGRPADAARSFRSCLQLGAPTALQQNAYSRLVEAHRRSGNLGSARAAAREYLDRFPDGRYAGEMAPLTEPQ